MSEHGLFRGWFEAFLASLRGETCTVESIDEIVGPQGASGSRIRYFLAEAETQAGERVEERLVIKECGRVERSTFALLGSQGCAVPPVFLPSIGGESGPVVMPFLDEFDEAGARPAAPLAAEALAGIHYANLGRPPAWLPAVGSDPMTVLWLHAGEQLWESALESSQFSREFGRYTASLYLAREGFLRALEDLTEEGDSLTVLNVDLLAEDVRAWRGKAVILDWEQAAYGSFYLDLPNQFTLETALVYRDALAARGFEIPPAEFLERYRELGRYMGLRYLGAALEDWHAGGDRRESRRWFLHYTLSLALRGR